jgi:hypothetical protein
MQPAYKIKIEDIAKGQFVRSAEGGEPDYLATPWGQQISRARVIGTIVDKYVSEDQSYAALRIDDGSVTIRLSLGGRMYLKLRTSTSVTLSMLLGGFENMAEKPTSCQMLSSW